MSFTLILGNKNYSSWSMRAWLLLRFVEAPFEEVLVELYTAESRRHVRGLGGQTGLVPVLKDGETTIWDTLAITSVSSAHSTSCSRQSPRGSRPTAYP